MRAVLVVNPNATTTSRRTRDVLAGALASEVELRIVQTSAPGHATEIARDAAADGVDLVVSLGGDGTVNEIVNGLLADHRDPHVPPAADLGDSVPMLGVVPGGSTNVFGRALGLPKDPVEATGELLEAVRERRSRSVSLGRLNGRWFTFCAGLGIDASVVARVERARGRGKRSTGFLYVRQATLEYFSELLGPQGRKNHRPKITMSADGESHGPLRWALVQNTAPWTYLGDRAIHVSREASFDGGLDAVGLGSFALGASVATATRLIFGDGPAGSEVVRLHNLPELTVAADEPVAAQLDGEFIGELTELRFHSALRAIRVAV